MAKKQTTGKIDIGGATEGLFNPFSNLELSGLPPGPEDVETDHSDNTLPISKPVSEKTVKRGRVVLRREKAQRGGKTVVVVGDIPAEIRDEEIEHISRDLRKACGSGGTVRGREIEIQGDQPARVCQWLEGAGFRVAGVRA